MDHPSSISTACLSGSLEDKLAAAAAARFHGIELTGNDLVVSSWSPGRIRQECARRGLTIDAYQPFTDAEAVPPDIFAATLRRADRTFAILEQLGTRTLVVSSSMSADAVDDDDLAAEHLHKLATRAEAHGARIAYEALARGRFVNTYAHAWRIVRRAGHPALGLCLDSFHILSRGDDPAGIRVIPGEKIFHLQVADAPRTSPDVTRLFPGLGSFDLTRFVGQVLSTGYAGPLALEVVNDVYRQADPRQAAIDGMRSLLALRESAGVTTPAAELPPAPELGGIVFTELAVDDTSGPSVARALTALGFSHAGQHRSKPVQLWQQARARVLLNFAAQRTVPPGTATICAFAVESADPVASTRRAEQFLAPALPGCAPPRRPSSPRSPRPTAPRSSSSTPTAGPATSCPPAQRRPPVETSPAPTISR
ncbi:sugar phosphate isomerase/epimerase and 4-hydroxyphenylpyruvate domain-containing protein [Paractinoplanes durhamensis]|uniref:sugar phosphate isomerase/epimerase and 4-hydroxyphenylpyruvate domain-containing protein n=1 Tax=Paractinoplanes durhamensis TaxID=113563 RepID=UPI00362AFFBC